MVTRISEIPPYQRKTVGLKFDGECTEAGKEVVVGLISSDDSNEIGIWLTENDETIYLPIDWLKRELRREKIIK